MITPPFSDAGEGGAEFRCLAFAPVSYRQTHKPALPAALGIYFCSHKDFTRFSRHSFAEDGHSLSYTRGDDRHDTLEFLLLSALLEDSVHPAGWRLFTRAQIPAAFTATSTRLRVASCAVCYTISAVARWRHGSRQICRTGH